MFYGFVNGSCYSIALHVPSIMQTFFIWHSSFVVEHWCVWVLLCVCRWTSEVSGAQVWMDMRRCSLSTHQPIKEKVFVCVHAHGCVQVHVCINAALQTGCEI